MGALEQAQEQTLRMMSFLDYVGALALSLATCSVILCIAGGDDDGAIGSVENATVNADKWIVGTKVVRCWEWTNKEWGQPWQWARCEVVQGNLKFSMICHTVEPICLQ